MRKKIIVMIVLCMVALGVYNIYCATQKIQKANALVVSSISLIEQDKYDEAISSLKESLEYRESYEVKELIEQVELLKDGIWTYKSNQLDNAIEIFESINIENSELYENAQEMIGTITGEQIENSLGIAKLKYDEEDYVQAYTYLSEAIELGSEEALNLENEYKEKSDESIRIAEEIRIKEEEEQRSRILSNITKNIDEFEGISWCYADGTPKRIGSFSFYCYVGEKNSRTWLRLKTGFHKSDWVFFEKISVKADEYKFEIPFDYYEDRDTDIGSGIYEWIDISVNSSLLSKLKKVTEADEVIVRFSGDYYKDYELSSKQKIRIKQIIDYYELMSEPVIAVH
jgi:tetratricopeptide (TPR) repeat protein